ncbi:MAG TPA: hypothetical protein VNS46_19460, partial [Nocardioides sp.]|nr:hypothetical protein [Nocardioides sp.]
MSQTDVDPAHDPDHTSDRLYTTTELEAFTEQQLEAPRAGAPADPLTDPIPHTGAPAGEHTAMRPGPVARPAGPPPSSPPSSSPPPSYRPTPPSAPPVP